MKKSQIQEIKEGRAMCERVWSGRLQPFGPKSNLSTKNAAEIRDAVEDGKQRLARLVESGQALELVAQKS